MNAEAVVTEIKNVSSYIATHGTQLPSDQLEKTTAAMSRSVLIMINNVKRLSAVTATTLTTEIDTTPFSEEVKHTLRSAVNTKMLIGCDSGCTKLANQKFAVPSNSQNLFTASDWATFNDSTASRSNKIDVLVRRCHRLGIDNPDQTMKCDLAVVLSHCHYNGGMASTKVLYDLAVDIKSYFETSPSPYVGRVDRFVTVPVELPEAVQVLAWEGEAPLVDQIPNWEFLRSKIASRSNSKLLRDSNAAPLVKTSRSGLTDPSAMLMAMMTHAQQNPAMRAQLAHMFGIEPPGGGGVTIYGEGRPRRQASCLSLTPDSGSDAASSVGALVAAPRALDNIIFPPAPPPETTVVGAAGAAPACVVPATAAPAGAAPAATAPAATAPAATAPAATAPTGTPTASTHPVGTLNMVEPSNSGTVLDTGAAAAKVGAMLAAHKHALEAAMLKKPKKPKKSDHAADAAEDDPYT